LASAAEIKCAGSKPARFDEVRRIAGATLRRVHLPYASHKGPDATDATPDLTPHYDPRMMTNTKNLTVCAETRCGITTLSKHEAN
jgi:hypothetical protein